MINRTSLIKDNIVPPSSGVEATYFMIPFGNETIHRCTLMAAANRSQHRRPVHHHVGGIVSRSSLRNIDTQSWLAIKCPPRPENWQ